MVTVSFTDIDRGGGIAGAYAAGHWIALAAVLRQVPEQPGHGWKKGRVDQRSPFPPECHQVGVLELLQVERKRRRRQSELIANPPRRQSLRAGLHKQPVDVEPSFLGKGSQGSKGVRFLHPSRVVEIIVTVNSAGQLK